MLKIIASLLTLLICVDSNAQLSYQYKSDRPQLSRSGEILLMNTFAIESGFSATILNSGNYSFNYNETLVRIGLMELMEMTVGFNVPANLNESVHSVGFASPKLGLKVLMKKKEEGVKMGLAFIFDGSINFGSKKFKDTKFLPSFAVAADIDFGPNTNVRLNYGAEWRENRFVLDPEGNPVIDPFIVLAGSINQTLHDRVVLFIEIFASVKYNNFRNDYWLRSGIIYKVKRNFYLDIAGGAGLSPQSPRGNVQIGFSGLWPKKNLPAASNVIITPIF